MTHELTNYVRRSLARGRVAPAVGAAAREWSRRRSLSPRVLDLDLRSRTAVMPAPVSAGSASPAGTAGFPETWSHDTADQELAWRAHRFGWALEIAAASNDAATARRLGDAVRTWRTRPEARDERVWDSYSISERLANWSLLASVLAARGDETLLTDMAFRTVIDEHARRLSQRLEDYGDGYTNNHSLNNARALYWYGAMWGAPAVRAAAGRLAVDRAGALFTPSGFLREASAHYHVLLTRTLLEIAMLARAAGDTATIDGIAGPAAGSVRGAAFLMAGGRLPLIGDVSPDAPPSWTGGVLSLAGEAGVEVDSAIDVAGAGWHTLWTDAPAGVPALPSSQATSVQDAGWHRVTAHGWDLLAHVNPDGAVGPRSHGHVDLGSFELTRAGHPIVVDRGLPARGAGDGWDARVGSSHTTATVDGYEPMLAWGINGYPSAMDRRYWDPRARASVQPERLDLTHEGFGRAIPGCTAARTVTLQPRRAIVEDRFSNAAGRTIDLFVQIDPSLDARREAGTAFHLAGDGVGIDAAWIVHGGEVMHADVDKGAGGGWHSPEYGRQVPAPRLHLRLRGSGATRVTLTFDSAA